VVTRNDQHATMVCDALNAGSHVVVTKPWAVNVAEAETMITTAFASMQAEPAEITEETVSGAVYGDEHIIYQEIADSLANVKPYPVTPADALGVSRILEAIKISSKEDRVVNL
ncbi:MAG: Gfo/Idh/MocA family oxidoreductase, partial [Lentisphaerae bacterium]|nr:Gfo/Idh/MocA family oxidoreductase [Lentisphaerota bacterium]